MSDQKVKIEQICADDTRKVCSPVNQAKNYPDVDDEELQETTLITPILEWPSINTSNLGTLIIKLLGGASMLFTSQKATRVAEHDILKVYLSKPGDFSSSLSEWLDLAVI